jgi:hypothetical protein
MFSYKYCIGGVLAVLAWHSHAQATQPDPSTATAVPPLSYESSLQGYRGFEPQPPGNWREANDNVGRIGGWQAYAAEVWEAGQSQDGGEDADVGADTDASNADDANTHQHH